MTLAADDVLLEELLQRLNDQPLAQRLLLGTAVYRMPVGQLGLVWQVGETVEPADQSQPPVPEPAGFAEAVALLEDLSLLSPFQLTDDEAPRHTVHRWTAGALARRFPQTLTEAHHRAARYWDWRVSNQPQSRQQDVEDMLEARYHYYQAGEIEQAVKFTGYACLQLDTWGAWGREEHLCRDVLTWVPEKSATAAMFLHQLGNVAYLRGDYEAALEWYRRSLEISEALGDRASMASSYSQIGVLLTETGKPEEAVPLNLRSLAIRLELGVPQVGISLYDLTHQREALGEQRFLDVLKQHLDENGVNAVLKLLEDFAAKQ